MAIGGGGGDLEWSHDRYHILFAYLTTLSIFQAVYFLGRNGLNSFVFAGFKLTTRQSENTIRKFCQILCN